MSQRILYNYFRSSASYRVRIALNIKNLEFEYAPIHLLKNGGEQNSAEFKQRNPMGQVPFLIDGENGISQSLAIIQYLDETYPAHTLFPRDPYLKAKVMEFCEVINSGVQPLINVSVLQLLTKTFQANDSQKLAWSQHFIKKGYEVLELSVNKTAGDFCFGDTLTAADVCLIPHVFGGTRNQINIEEFPTLARIYETCEKLDSFKKSHPKAQPDFES